ncbi:histidine kinase [Cellulomonas fimi]|uniref:histidine kinase n=1 Tax=Cellulomonas fimi TaxID=1708 RepID=UPI00234C59A0|nr:histidine kinase [Cellulomonas fimi]MDC7121944.1 histidine kinase [Cellulomonas fimi]
MADDDAVSQRYDGAARRGHDRVATRPGPLAGVLAGVVGVSLALSPELVLVPGGAYLTHPPLQSPLLLAAIAAVVVGVLVARRHPGWATVLVLMPFATTVWTGWFVLGWWAGLVAVAAVAAHRGPRRALLPAAAAVAVTAWFTVSDIIASVPLGSSAVGDGRDELVSIAAMLGLLLVAITIATVGGMVDRPREPDAAPDDDAAAERARLARELTDAAARRISLVAARAETAPPYRYRDGGADRRAALAALAVDARRALGELRHALVVLDDADARADRPGPAGRAEPGLRAGALR